jgi:tRNA dimethylallyltransferase
MADNKNNTVYIISGPTAVGKSVVGFYLARRIGGEIVNCDSVQLYRHMDIGSAMPDSRDMKEIPHHLYQIIDPDYNMTVAKYQELALTVIDNVLSRGKTPIVVGGTGLYLNSILYDMDFAAKPRNTKRREELEQMAEKNGSEYMFEYLSAIDPESAARIHPNNTRKVIRAIEAFELGSQVKSMDKLKKNPAYDFRLYGLNMDREWLYNRINKRVLKLIRAGLIDEVKALLDMGYDENTPAMKAIGYKELIGYVRGEKDLKSCIYEIMKNTRHYAKRQITWLRRYDDLKWIEIEKGETVGAVVDKILGIETAPDDAFSE